jgi:hypothetical protein
MADPLQDRLDVMRLFRAEVYLEVGAGREVGDMVVLHHFEWPFQRHRLYMRGPMRFLRDRQGSADLEYPLREMNRPMEGRQIE